jgi:hypothetical protein
MRWLQYRTLKGPPSRVSVTYEITVKLPSAPRMSTAQSAAHPRNTGCKGQGDSETRRSAINNKALTLVRNGTLPHRGLKVANPGPSEDYNVRTSTRRRRRLFQWEEATLRCREGWPEVERLDSEDQVD